MQQWKSSGQERTWHITHQSPSIKGIHIEHEMNWTRALDMGGISFSVEGVASGEIRL